MNNTHKNPAANSKGGRHKKSQFSLSLPYISIDADCTLQKNTSQYPLRPCQGDHTSCNRVHGMELGLFDLLSSTLRTQSQTLTTALWQKGPYHTKQKVACTSSLRSSMPRYTCPYCRGSAPGRIHTQILKQNLHPNRETDTTH